MRYLHAVAAHEKFVASGTFVAYKDAQPTGVTEAWTIHELGDGSQFIRSDYDARRVNGQSRLVEALRDKDGKVGRFIAHWYETNTDKSQSLTKINVTVFETYTQVSLWKDQGEPEQNEIHFTESFLTLPPVLVCTGRVIRQVEQSDTLQIFQPIGMAVQASMDIPAIANHLGDEEISIGNQAFSADVYEFGDHRYWIDEHDLPLKLVSRRSNQHNLWKLTRYAHRP